MVIRLTNMLRTVGYILLAVCLVLITYFSLFRVANNLARLTSDKFLHSIAYSALGFSMYLSFMPLKKKVGREKDDSVHLTNSFTYIILILFIAGMAYGGVMEILQGYVGRDCSMMDLASDGLGLIIGFAFCNIFLGCVNKLFSCLPY